MVRHHPDRSGLFSTCRIDSRRRGKRRSPNCWRAIDRFADHGGLFTFAAAQLALWQQDRWSAAIGHYPDPVVAL